MKKRLCIFKKFRFIKRCIALLFVAIFALFITNLDYTFSKYFQKTNLTGANGVSMNSTQFYFIGDAFNGTVESPIVIESASPGIICGMMNYSGSNITNQNIPYSVKVFQGASDITSSLTITDSGSGILTGNSSKNNTINISGFATNNNQATTYTVKIKSSSPYIKELTSVYQITRLKDLVISSLDTSTSPYASITVNTNDFSLGEGLTTKAFSLAWPNNVIPDNTSPGLENATTSPCTVNLAPNSSYVYRFIITSGTVVLGGFSIS